MENRINLDIKILNEVTEVNKLAEQKEEVIDFITSLSYDTKDGFDNLKKLKTSFNKKRLDWYKSITGPADKINKELLEIEKVIKAKEEEFAKVDAKKTKEFVNVLYASVRDKIVDLYDKEFDNIFVEFKDEITKAICKPIYSTLKTGEIKIIKGNFDKTGQLKEDKFLEIKKFIDNLTLYSRLGQIGKTKFKENGYDYIDAVDFQEKQIRIIEEEKAKRDLEEAKAKAKADELRAEAKAIKDNAKLSGEEKANIDLIEEDEDISIDEEVVVSSTTTIIVEVDNGIKDNFINMLRNKNIKFEIK